MKIRIIKLRKFENQICACLIVTNVKIFFHSTAAKVSRCTSREPKFKLWFSFANFLSSWYSNWRRKIVFRETMVPARSSCSRWSSSGRKVSGHDICHRLVLSWRHAPGVSRFLFWKWERDLKSWNLLITFNFSYIYIIEQGFISKHFKVYVCHGKVP